MEGQYKILKIYVDETAKWHGQALYHAIVLRLKQIGIAGATVVRGIEGYGSDSIVHRARVLELSVDLPVIIEVIDKKEQIEQIIPEISEMVGKGLVISMDVQIHKFGKNQ